MKLDWQEVHPWFYLATEGDSTRVTIHAWNDDDTYVLQPGSRWYWAAKAKRDSAQPGIHTIQGWSKTLEEAKTASEKALDLIGSLARPEG